MKTESDRSSFRKRWLLGGLGGGLFAFGGIALPLWWSPLNRWIDGAVHSFKASSPNSDSHDDAHDSVPGEHSHADEGHDHSVGGDIQSLELTSQALKNLGLTSEYLKPIQLTSFYRSVTIPAIVVAKPGRTNIQVSSPMIGIVQHVHAVSGEAVEPGDMLFEVRLTYEDLVETQTLLLKNLADLAVEQREIARLEEVTRSGAVASKLLLERQYALQKLQGSITAQRAGLKLHGLNDEQIDRIVREQRLLRDLIIVAPELDTHDHEEDRLRLSNRTIHSASYKAHDTQENPADVESASHVEAATPLIVERLSVSKGQGVQAGQMLCTLSDYSTLYIEGKAFEQDAPAIAAVAAKGWPIEAVLPGASGPETVSDLKLTYVANAVDSESRTLSFFVDLPNEKLRDEKSAQGQRFVTWKYRIGQRLEVRVPVEAWEQQIVLPVDAAVKDGADWYVFQQNGDHFDRVPVHVKHRDQHFVVIENDGAIYPGDVIAMRSAHQMLMALKNKSGASPDPHAGHSH